jgi:type IV secretion system protein TrbI
MKTTAQKRKVQPELPGLHDHHAAQSTDRLEAPIDVANDAAADDLVITHSAKLDPAALELRGKPVAVKRLSPRAIIFLSALALSIIGGVTIAALRPPKLNDANKPRELYETANKPKAAELEALPQNYTDWIEKIAQGKKLDSPPSIPILGPPLPGDIGHAYALQNGLAAEPAGSAASPYAASAALSAAQQARAEQQRTIEQARSSGLIFAGKGGGTPAAAARSESEDMADLLQRLAAAPAVSNIDSRSTRSEPQATLNGAPDDTDAANMQTRRRDDQSTLNPHALTPLVSPFTLLAGSLIPAALIGDMNSDLPGMVQALVTEDVYDSVTGTWRLIPQGAKLIGSYDARVLFGQERALLVWTRLILPDGSSMLLDQFNGTDSRGQAGLSDQVDWHSGRLIKGIILSSLLGVGSELSLGDTNDSSLRALARAIQDSGNSASQEIIKRNLQVKPTLRIRGGTRLNVLVSSDMILKPWSVKP